MDEKIGEEKRGVVGRVEFRKEKGRIGKKYG